MILDRQGSQVMFGDPRQAAFPALTPEDSILADRHASIISVRATPFTFLLVFFLIFSTNRQSALEKQVLFPHSTFK